MVDLVAGETAADNRYVTVNGSDIRPEMHIGRFPVNSRAEAQTMVSKTLGYEQNPPPGDWNGRVLFVADNQPDDPGKDAGDFWDLSEDLVTNFLPVPPYTSTRVYYDRWSSSFIPGYPGPPRFPPPFYDSTSGTRSAIVAGINQGHLLVNYIGHGATQVWGQNFLKDEDIDASLANGGMLPVMLPMTCREGYFIYPYGESLDQCMGETFVRVDGKGAVASWSPTGYGCAAGHHLLNQAFFTAVFTDDVREVGLATTLAKRHLYDTGTYLDLMDTYVLFGDPALRLHTLPADVSITKTVDPVGPVLPGDPLSYTLTFTNAGPATAHHVVVTDTLPPELINAAFVSSGAVITPRLGTRFVWDVEDLTAGEGGTITVTATVHPAFSGLISNIARIATTARETDTLNADQAVIVVTHPDAVMITVTPEEGGTLTYTDAQGLTTTIEVPPGAVSEAVTLVFTPLPAPTHPTDLQFAGHAFTLEVYQDGELLSDYAFLAPVDVTIHYSDQDVAGLDESALMLERWNGTAWEDAACGAYDRHPDANWLSVPICHLSQFALLGRAPAVPVGGITLPTAALPRAWRFHAQPVGAEAIALTVAIITMAASALGAERFRRRR
jgi:uncharacterized repeat protein (TIGR01451 family)